MLVVVVHTFEWSSIPIVMMTFLPLSARNWLNDVPLIRGRFNVHRKIRRADGLIILLVTVLTILTNLGYAIIAGILFATLMYTWDSAKALKHSSVTIRRKKVSYSKQSTPSGYHDKDGLHQPSPSPLGDDGIANGHSTGNNVEMNAMRKVDSVSERNESAEDTENEEDGAAESAQYEKVKIYILEGPLMFSNANRLPSIFNWNTDPDVVEIHLQNCNVYDYTAMNQLSPDMFILNRNVI